jgi:hypothetical protein
MRQLLTLLLLISGYASFAQGKGFLIYTELGGGGGNAGYIKYGLTAEIGQKHAFSIVAYQHFKKADNLPLDYNAGSSLFGSSTKPGTNLRSVNLMYGRAIFLPKTEWVRVNLRGGVSLGQYTYPDKFQRYQEPPSSGNFFHLDFNDPANYTYENTTKTAIGVVFNPVVELAFTKVFGVSCGMYANVNDRKFIGGFEVNLLLGLVKSHGNDNWE